MKKTLKRIAAILTAMSIAITAFSPVTAEAAAKRGKIVLNKYKTTLTMTNKKLKPSTTVRVKLSVRLRKPVRWKNYDKDIISIKKTGKYTCKITAKKKGTALVECRVNNSALYCLVKVKDKIKYKTVYKRVPIYENRPVYEEQPVYTKEYHIICNCGVDCGRDRSPHIEATGCWAGYSVQPVQVQTGTRKVKVGTRKVRVGTKRVAVKVPI